MSRTISKRSRAFSEKKIVGVCIFIFAKMCVATSFNEDIRPILSEKCFLCHGPDEASRKAGLRLDEAASAYKKRRRTAAIVPNDPDSSELIRRIETLDEDEQMPPIDSKLSLSKEEKRALRKWISGGAEYEGHWAFQPIVKPPIPQIDQDEMSLNPIDRFIRKKLLEKGLDFSPPAPPEKLLRRLTFDLTGLPPTLEELDEFLAKPAPGRVERAVEDLLQRESFGERMASEWLDVARYSDTYGYQVDRDRFVWPWRDWVISAFNQNLRYDDFIIWQLAGDLLKNPSQEQILATTFNRLHPQKVEGGSVPEEFRIEYVVDRTQTASTAFMGLTMECARCHDHKYDPISQREFYEMSAFFSNIDEAGLYSYFTDSVPTPTMILSSEKEKMMLDSKRRKLQKVKLKYDRAFQESEDRFEDWLEDQNEDQNEDQFEDRRGIGEFGFDQFEKGKLINDHNLQKPAHSSSSNRLVKGFLKKGIQLSGDDEIDLKIGNFTRWQPFSFSFWLYIPQHFERAVIFHRSRAWTDAGSRGYEFLLEDGRASFSLVHFMPGNAIGVRSVSPLPLNRFVHLGIVYDGSSKAEGIRIFLDGQLVKLKIIRDNLTKNITGGGHDHIGIGARFRDVGFKKGIVDEFHVFDFELSELEIRDEFEFGTLSSLLKKARNEMTKDDLRLLREFYSFAVDADLRGFEKEIMKAHSAFAKVQDGLKEIMVMRESPVRRASFVLHRGEYDERREAVNTSTPKALPAFDASFPRNRLGLAFWMTSPSHPLTARVVVNRYWQMIFGEGLVRTPEDFGNQGQAPTHPELLDWLAADFIENDWNVKLLLKKMLTSRTYRQGSESSKRQLSFDHENRLLSRSSRHRLSAEMIRDNALKVSGLLVNRLGGPPVKPYEIAVSFKPSEADSGEGLYRRSLYTYWKRTAPAPVMRTLDASKRDVCSVKRESTTTPLQAFVFMNDPQFVEAAQSLARKIIQENIWKKAKYENEKVDHDHHEDHTDHTENHDHHLDHELDHIFRLLTSRRANVAEMAILRMLFSDQNAYFEADEKRVKSFLGAKKGAVNESEFSAKWAALSVVTLGLFSHDECLMKW